ncbi:MAG: uroporphyrinogen decarboxylase family protein [Planctomycetota bacterium]
MTAALTHRRRVLLALDHQATDRVPISQVCAGITPPAREALEGYLRKARGIGVDEYLRPLIDVKIIAPDYVGPPLAPGVDLWGVHRTPVSYGAGQYNEIDHYPLAECETPADLDRHRWPDLDGFDYAALPETIDAVQADGPYALIVMNGNIFESSWYMRGFERMMMDFVLNPELAHAIIERVTDYFVGFFTRVLQAARGRIDLVFTADDIGGQQGLLMSLPMWERFIKPRHARLNDVIHDHGARVVYHTDGAVMDAVGGLIDMGIDVLEALQFDAAGMDPHLLKDRWGDRLCFEGGISVQTTLPFATPAAVAAEVRDRIAVLGRGGGYILSPSHAIQAGTPPENVVAMFDTAAATPMT